MEALGGTNAPESDYVSATFVNYTVHSKGLYIIYYLLSSGLMLISLIYPNGVTIIDASGTSLSTLRLFIIPRWSKRTLNYYIKLLTLYYYKLYKYNRLRLPVYPSGYPE